jgi:hypothetical protein
MRRASRRAAGTGSRCLGQRVRGPLLELAADLLLLGELLLCLVLWLVVPLAWLTLAGLVSAQTHSAGAGLIAALAGTVASATATLYAARRIDHLRIDARKAAGRPAKGDPLAAALVWLTVLSGLAVVVWFLFFQGGQNAGPLP